MAFEELGGNRHFCDDYKKILICTKLWPKQGFTIAGDGNRTHMTSLEGWSFTTKLRPRICPILPEKSRIVKSNPIKKKGESVPIKPALIKVSRKPYHPKEVQTQSRPIELMAIQFIL